MTSACDTAHCVANGSTSTWTPASMVAAASAGPLLVLIAFTVPLTTLTSTARDLSAGPSLQAWIMSGMSVGAAAGLLVSGAVGDHYGRRRAFIFGCAVLASTSLLAAVAPDSLTFVVARILQGVGGAAILACSLGIVGHLFPAGSERVRSTGIWAAALGAGVAIGPLLSAGLDHLVGWRVPHLITGLGAIVLAMVGQRLPESRASNPHPIDVVGAVLLALSVASLLTGLTELRAGPSPSVVILLIAAPSLMAGFIFTERRVHAPLFDLELFRSAHFVVATIAALAAGAGVLSLVSFVPTLLERTNGMGTVPGATLLLAWSATSVVTAFGARWIPTSVTPRLRLIGSLICAAIGQLVLFAPGESTLRPLIGLLIAGAANGVLNAALGHEAVATVPRDRAAMGSGANNTARYIGSALGLTIVTVLVAHGATSGPDRLMSGWNTAVIVTAAISVFGAVAALLLPHLHGRTTHARYRHE